MQNFVMVAFRNILALDTAMNGCSAAVCRAGTVPDFSESEPMLRGQAERLVPMVQNVLNRAGMAFSDLDAVITTLGPGAFTGLRIGISTAKTLGLALNIPVLGMTTLQVLALQYLRDHKVPGALGVLIETRRDDFYFQMFAADGTAVSDAMSVSAVDVSRLVQGKDLVLIGDALQRFRGQMEEPSGAIVFTDGYDLPDPAFMAQSVIEFRAKKSFFYSELTPVYLRSPDVSFPKKPQRVIA